MATAAQAAANQANAQFSTGPVTDAGKAASSKNALKFGFTAQTVLLPGEDEAAYRKLCDDTFRYWVPAYEQERVLLQILCDTQWRLARCPRLEATVFSAEAPDMKALDIISKHEARLKKQVTSTLKDLAELFTARRGWVKDRMEEAKTIRRADIIKERETNLKAIGFDFSTAQVDAAIRCEDALQDARNVVYDEDFGDDNLSDADLGGF